MVEVFFFTSSSTIIYGVVVLNCVMFEVESLSLVSFYVCVAMSL